MSDPVNPTLTLYRDKRNGQLVSVISELDADAPWRTDFYSTRDAPPGTPRWEVDGAVYFYQGWAGDNGWISDGWRDFLRHHEPVGTER